MNKRYLFALGLALMLAFQLWNVTLADEPEGGPAQAQGRQVGLVSTTAECVTIEAGGSGSVPATVRIEWEGQIERAFLVLAPAGSEGGHSIYLNGQRVASAPRQTEGRPCQSGFRQEIPIPPAALVHGENVILLTNDADAGDSWTAADLRLEIHGVLSGPPAAALDLPPSPPPGSQLSATGAVSGSAILTSTYELAQSKVITQVMYYQIPASYAGAPTPLVISIHGMYGTGLGALNLLASEADERGWLLAAPDMHGRFYSNTGWYALAWLGAQHDIIDTIDYMRSNYKVDTSRIYLVGGSMGGQTTSVTAAKYPDVFAAAVPWKPITDLTDWHGELLALGDPYSDAEKVRRETAGNFTGTTPEQAPFEYQRRSAIEMPQNVRLIPLKMWHDVDDLYVPIHHSRDLKLAITGWNPVTPVTLIEVPSGANDCPPYQHCYNPDPNELFDFLQGYTRSTQPPAAVKVRTDESKPFYWLSVAQTGGGHWSQVDASYNPATNTVTATISDTKPLTLGFNLGSTAIVGPAGIPRPGMGLPDTTYLVKGGGNFALVDYTSASGYLTTTLTITGQFALTISAIKVELSPDPAAIPVPKGQSSATATITAVVKDQLNNLVPNGTTVEFSTTKGTWPGGGTTYVTTVSGGQATAVLTLPAADKVAVVKADVGKASATLSVYAVQPAIYLPAVLK